MKPTRIVCLLLAGMWACATPKLQVTKMDFPSGMTEMPAAPTDDSGGMYYALPLSIITIDIPVTETVRTMSNCFWKPLLEERLEKAGAKTLLHKWGVDSVGGTPDVVTAKPYTVYKLHTNEIAIGTRPVPDPSKVYYASLKNKWNRNQQLTLNLNELGQLTKGEFVNEDRTFDLIVQGISSVAGIISAISPTKDAAGNSPSLSTQVANFGTDVCQQKKENLLAIRAARFSLFPNINSNNGDNMIFKRKLDELDALEQSLVADLTFAEKKTKAILHIDILVQNLDGLKNIALFSYHNEKGINILAKPVTGSYQNEYLTAFASADTIAGGKKYYLTFDYAKGSQFADRAYASSNDKAVKPGLAYNVPVWVRGRVQVDKEKPVAVAMLPMPQLGKVAYLPERASKVGFELDPVTGSLRTSSLQQTGLSAVQVKAAGEAVSSGITAVKKPAEKTELEKIQAENSLLEQQIKKINQQSKLDSLYKSQSRGVN